VLEAARQSRPKELADTHRVVLAMRYAEALAAHPNANHPTVREARERFAQAVGRRSADDVPASLHGLFFY
jgi:hypothetical protein